MWQQHVWSDGSDSGICSSQNSARDPQVPIGDPPPLCVGGTREYHP